MKKSQLTKIIKEELTAVLKEEGYFGPSQGTEEEAMTLIAQEQTALLKKLKAAGIEKDEAFIIVKKARISTLQSLSNGATFGAARKHMQSFFPSKNQISKPAAVAQAKTASADVQARIVGTKKVGDKMVVTMKDASGRTVSGSAKIRGGNFGMAKTAAAANARNKLASSAP